MIWHPQGLMVDKTSKVIEYAMGEVRYTIDNQGWYKLHGRRESKKKG
jgi:hypothetical protein